MQAAQLEEETIRDWLIRRSARQLQAPISDVDSSAPMMSLGIDSLDLIGIAGELAEFLGRDIRAEVLWECETIDALAHFLASPPSLVAPKPDIFSNEVEDRQCYLVEHQPGAVGVRPVIGVGFKGVAMLAAMRLPSDVPIHTVTGLVGRQETSIRPISTIAVDCVATITENFEHEQLTLLGFSWCGFVAYEVACRLASLGHDVCLYLLEPAPFDSVEPEEKTIERIKRYGEALTGKSGIDLVRYCFEKTDSVSRQILRRTRQRLLRPYYLRKLRDGKPVPSGFRWKTIRPSIGNNIGEHVRSVFGGPTKLFGRPRWIDLHAASWSRVLTSVEVVPLLDCFHHEHCTAIDRPQSWVDVLTRDYAFELAARSCLSLPQKTSKGRTTSLLEKN